MKFLSPLRLFRLWSQTRKYEGRDEKKMSDHSTAIFVGLGHGAVGGTANRLCSRFFTANPTAQERRYDAGYTGLDGTYARQAP